METEQMALQRAHFCYVGWTTWAFRPACWNQLTNGETQQTGNMKWFSVLLFLWDFFSLLHLKTGSPSSLFVFVSQECESSIKRLINLEARRQSCPCSWSSAWDREKRSESERQRERKLNGKWSELEWKTRGGFLNEGQSLKTLSAQFVLFSSPRVVFTPGESPRSLPL